MLVPRPTSRWRAPGRGMRAPRPSRRCRSKCGASPPHLAAN